MNPVRPIPVASIDAGDRLRMLDPAWVQTLAEDIRLEGLQEPIRIVERGDRFRLISGARRLAAVQLLGHDKIRARVAPATAYADEAAIRRAEIKADMLRGELNALDFAVYVAEWCGLYREAQGPVKPGPKPKAKPTDEELTEFSINVILNWTAAAQQALQISRPTVFRSMKIASIAAELRARISLHPIANVQRELLLLAEQDVEWQASAVSMLTADPAEAETVSQALTLLRNDPAPQRPPVYEQFTQRFAVWKQTEQHAFLDLNAEVVDRWNAQRPTARKGKAVLK